MKRFLQSSNTNENNGNKKDDSHNDGSSQPKKKKVQWWWASMVARWLSDWLGIDLDPTSMQTRLLRNAGITLRHVPLKQQQEQVPYRGWIDLVELQWKWTVTGHMTHVTLLVSGVHVTLLPLPTTTDPTSHESNSCPNKPCKEEENTTASSDDQGNDNNLWDYELVSPFDEATLGISASSSSSSSDQNHQNASNDTATNKWRTNRYLQHILDQLTLTIETVVITIDLDTNERLELSMDQLELKPTTVPGSTNTSTTSTTGPLHQQLQVRGLQARILVLQEQEQQDNNKTLRDNHTRSMDQEFVSSSLIVVDSWPVMDSWHGVLQIQRMEGRRFVDSLWSGLCLHGVEPSCAPLRIHWSSSLWRIGPFVETWQSHFQQKPQTKHNETGELASTGSTAPATTFCPSQFTLPFASIDLVLEETGAIVSLQNCQWSLQGDGSHDWTFQGSPMVYSTKSSSVIVPVKWHVDWTKHCVHVMSAQGTSPEATREDEQESKSAVSPTCQGPYPRLEFNLEDWKTLVEGTKTIWSDLFHSSVSSSLSAHSCQEHVAETSPPPSTAPAITTLQTGWSLEFGNELAVRFKRRTSPNDNDSPLCEEEEEEWIECGLRGLQTQWEPTTAGGGGCRVEWDRIQVTTNWTANQPVLSLPSGQWDSGSNQLVFNDAQESVITLDQHGIQKLYMWWKELDLSQIFVQESRATPSPLSLPLEEHTASPSSFRPSTLQLSLPKIRVNWWSPDDSLRPVEPSKQVILVDSMCINADLQNDTLCMGWNSLEMRDDNTQMVFSLREIGNLKLQQVKGSFVSCSIGESGTLDCRITLPGDRWLDLKVESPTVRRPSETEAGSPSSPPFVVEWKRLEIAHCSSIGERVDLSVPAATSDGQTISISEQLSVEASTLSAFGSFSSFVSQVARCFSFMGNMNMLFECPVRLKMATCCISVESVDLIMNNVEVDGIMCSCERIRARGVNGKESLLCLEALSIFVSNDDTLCIQSTFSVVAASLNDTVRISSPIDNVVATFHGNLFHPAGHGDARSTAYVPFHCDIAVKTVKLDVLPTTNDSEIDLSSSVQLDQSKLSIKNVGSFVHWAFSCEHLCCWRTRHSPFQTDLKGLEVSSKTNPQQNLSTSHLSIPCVGELCELNLSIQRLHRLSNDTYALVSPVDGITASLQGGIMIIQSPRVELETQAPNRDCHRITRSTFVLPLPVQAHVDECVVFKTCSDGEHLKLVSLGTSSIYFERALGDETGGVRIQIVKALDVVYLETIRVPEIKASAIVRPERLDVFRKVEVHLDAAEITADFSSEEWNRHLAVNESSHLYQLPLIRISAFEVVLHFKKGVASVSDAVLKLSAVIGSHETDSSVLVAHYTDQIKKRIPYLFLKTDVLGANVGDSMSSVAASVAFRSTIGGSVAGVVGYDAISSAISMGKKSRGAEQTERYKFGDLSRGLVQSVREASKAGSRMRGDDQYELGDVTAGAASAAMQYTSENRVRLSSAVGSGMGMAAGFAIAGPVGMIGGALLGSRAAGEVVAQTTGDPKKDKSRPMLNDSSHRAPGNDRKPVKHGSSRVSAPPENMFTGATSRRSVSVSTRSQTSQNSHTPHRSTEQNRHDLSTNTANHHNQHARNLTLPSPSLGHSNSPHNCTREQVISSSQPSPTHNGSADRRHRSSALDLKQEQGSDRLVSSAHAMKQDRRRPQSGFRGSQSMQQQRPSPTRDSSQQQPGETAEGYKFGDITRGIIARGKQLRGETKDSNYRFGDFTRGLFGGP